MGQSGSQKGTSHPNPVETFQVRDAFKVLRIVSDQQLITGFDDWRHETGKDSIGNFDERVKELVQKQPPSKFGKAERPSLWTAIHFYVALPSLSYAIDMYGKNDEHTKKLIISNSELQKYFIAFPYIAKHYHEYKEFVMLFGKPSEELWRSMLQEQLSSTENGNSAVGQLSALPKYLSDKAYSVLSGQDDSLVGRIVLAYLLGQGTNPSELAMDNRITTYLAPMREGAPTQPLFERLIAAQQELEQIEPYLRSYDKNKGLRLDAFLGLVTWYARPHLVEMVIPGLTGAAEPGVRALLALFDHIVENGGPDYTRIAASDLPSIQKLRGTQSLEAIGRISIIKDILDPLNRMESSDGTTIRRLVSTMYSEPERLEAWGNSTYYIPDAHRKSGFTTFRQDVADIVYCAGLLTEESNMAGTVDPEELKRLARKLVSTRSLGTMRVVMQNNRRILNDLAIEWELRYAGQERLRLLRFIRQTFGLDAIRPIPISLKDLDRGFAGSYLEGHVYHLRYQEAGEKLNMAITVNTSPKPAQQVRYRTSDSLAECRVTSDGIPYSAWLEVTGASSDSHLVIPVPGRGSYDPFGRVGSAHAGEVIGFGCSVHHASLAIILAELASLGASRGDLEHVTAAFMHINKQVHERHDLAAFQLAQILAVFGTGKEYTYRDFLNERAELVKDQDRPHLAAYVRLGEKSLAWAEPRAAILTFGFPALYSAREKSDISPRHSWYDGSTVELPETVMNWQVLTC